MWWLMLANVDVSILDEIRFLEFSVVKQRPVTHTHTSAGMSTHTAYLYLKCDQPIKLPFLSV